jgi:hypothetical protein
MVGNPAFDNDFIESAPLSLRESGFLLPRWLPGIFLTKIKGSFRASLKSRSRRKKAHFLNFQTGCFPEQFEPRHLGAYQMGLEFSDTLYRNDAPFRLLSNVKRIYIFRRECFALHSGQEQFEDEFCQ